MANPARNPKISQVVAVATTAKAQADKSLTDVYHVLQKPDLFSGLTRTYTPKQEGGDEKPPERKNPQYTVKDLYRKVEADLSDMLNWGMTLDVANCTARADVEVDGQVLVPQAPVTFLLFLEKKVTDLMTFVGKMPLRDGADNWVYQGESNLYVTPVTKKYVTAKLQRPIVLYDATDKHPAQTQLITEDITVGSWEERRFSGAITRQEQEDMLARLRKLSTAVKVAREAANAAETTRLSVADPILNYVFGGVLR